MTDRSEAHLTEQRSSTTTLGVYICWAAALSVGAVVAGFVAGLGWASFCVTCRMMGVG